ncbi:MAG: D-inositol-3-phosphate glycosyltransferase [Elusimicrobia bacterium]|nr:D-inositol-3-phosphate glycosyltransferase [Elusimicrobiota bacterium]
MVPLPPPWAGVEQMSQVLLESSLVKQYQVQVIRGNIRDSNAAKGKWDLSGTSRVLSLCFRLTIKLTVFRPHILYITLSQNTSGLARDFAYILLSSLFGVPVVAHLHGSKLREFIELQSPVPKKIVLSMLNRIKLLVVCANSIGADLKEVFPQLEIETVYNAIPKMREGPSKLPRSKARNVSFMGHFSVAKGFYDVIRAIPLVLSKFPDVHFHFAGERLDNERNIRLSQKGRWEEVEKTIKRFPQNIHFWGVVEGPDKEKFFEQADIFILPSYAEAFPVAVLEALGAGLPVIATPVGALPEVLKDGDDVLFVQPGKPSEVAHRIMDLIEDSKLRERLSQNALALSQKFYPDVFAQSMARVFEKSL